MTEDSSFLFFHPLTLLNDCCTQREKWYSLLENGYLVLKRLESQFSPNPVHLTKQQRLYPSYKICFLPYAVFSKKMQEAFYSII